MRAEDLSQRSNSKAWWIYIAGSLRVAAEQRELGLTELRGVFLLPDNRMAHHFARLALARHTDARP